MKILSLALVTVVSLSLLACGEDEAGNGEGHPAAPTAVSTAAASPPAMEPASTTTPGATEPAAASDPVQLTSADTALCERAKSVTDAQPGSLVPNLHLLQMDIMPIRAGLVHRDFAPFADALEEAEERARRTEGGTYTGHEATLELISVLEDILATCNDLGWQ